MDRPALLNMPAEIRNLIYDYTLSSPSQREVCWMVGHPLPAITQTCRQIRAETRTMFFSSTTFRVFLWPESHSHFGTTPLSLFLWLLSIGSDACAAIRKLEIGVEANTFQSPGSSIYAEANPELGAAFETIGWHPSTQALRVKAVTAMPLLGAVPIYEEYWQVDQKVAAFLRESMVRGRASAQGRVKGALWELVHKYAPLSAWSKRMWWRAMKLEESVSAVLGYAVSSIPEFGYRGRRMSEDGLLVRKDGSQIAT